MIIHGDVAFMILSTVLVLIMTPGLALFYAGLVERKNSLTIMYQSFISIGVVTLLWIFGGFSLVFGPDISGVIGNPMTFFFFKDVGFESSNIYLPNIPFIMFFMYQLMFAIITAPLMTGAYANRLTISAWIKILILWMIFIYFPVAHWVWGNGFLAKLGFLDYAGGTTIHITSGFGCLGGLLFIGNRAYKNQKGPFNLGLVTIGAMILLFGWFGFNAGGSLAAADTAAIVFANTGLAGAASMVIWTILHYIKHKSFSFSELIIGMVAGLATVTPAAGYINPIGATIIGVIAAIICFFCVDFEHKWKKLDDALDVWGVHGMGGFIGSLCIGIFADITINGVQPGVKQFLIQLFGSVLVAIYSIVVTYVIFWLVDKTGKIVVSAEVQKNGLDREFFGENYSDYRE